MGRQPPTEEGQESSAHIDAVHDPGALLRQGVLLHQAGQLPEAIEFYRRLLVLQPNNAVVLSNLGFALHGIGEYKKAVVACRQAVAIKPDLAQAHCNLGNSLQKLGRFAEAAKSCRDAIAVKPDYAEAHNNLGNALYDMGQIEEAIGCYEKAIAIKPAYSRAYSNLGNAMREVGRLQEAIKCCNRAIELQPHNAEAYGNLGNILNAQGRVQEAKEAMDKALSIAPQDLMIRHKMAYVDMALGNCAPAWEGYERRIALTPELHSHFPYPRWQGEPLAGRTVLVYAEQGVGDEISFSLFFNDLASLAARCLVLCDPRLVPLYERSFPEIEIIGAPREKYRQLIQSMPPVDFQFAAGSLAKYLRPELDDLKPSLIADPLRVEHWRQRFAELGPEPKIGISWSTSKKNAFRRLAHSNLEEWGPILGVPKVKFVNLFYGDVTDDLEYARKEFNIDIINFAGSEIDLYDDFDDLFAMMSALDMIITTPSSIATLACNLGKKCWYFYTPRIMWRTMGKNHVPWFMEANPLYFSNPEEFAAAAVRAAKAVRALTDKHCQQ